MPGWTLQGRLNIRNSNDSDTININWQQDGADFEISLSGTLGLGAVRLSGGRAGVLIERAGEAPQTAASLEAVGTDTLGYAFPAEQLLFWIRGLSAPGGRAEITRNPEGLVATLSQPGGDGRRWELQYDRYRDIDGHILPGRIRLEQSPWRLTFVVSDWILPGESP